ncbi:unnamed protein product [Brassica oleracea var. botrytis]
MMSSSSSATDTITKPLSLPTVESVTCDTCGFTEECTPAYIHRVKDRYKGHWLCGLCAEAVKDEVVRSPTRISVEEALRRHTTFCHRFRSCSPDEEEDPISVIGRILRRSLDGSPRRTTTRTSSSGALPGIDGVESRRSLLRTGSCFPNMDKIKELKEQLSESFAMKDMGPAKQILGMRIVRDRGEKLIHLSQEKYIEKVLKRFHMDKSKVQRSSSLPKMMHMTFYWGIKATILFDFWKTDSWLSYILTLLACFVFAAFYQYLENRRLQFKSLSSTRHPPSPPPAFPLLLSPNRAPDPPRKLRRWCFSA